MKSKFVLVNNSILDFEVYREDFKGIATSLKAEIFEAARLHDFELVKIGKLSDFRHKAVFYNRKLDMQLIIVLRKKAPLEFV